ncbi:MAG: hypothetical protein H6609_21000 [Ignavibacteriales bacterium]|nr:hypothetical protein [Ignavibacteriales bacterium]
MGNSKINNIVVEDSHFEGVEKDNILNKVGNLKLSEVYINQKLFKN